MLNSKRDNNRESSSAALNQCADSRQHPKYCSEHSASTLYTVSDSGKYSNKVGDVFLESEMYSAYVAELSADSKNTSEVLPYSAPDVFGTRQGTPVHISEPMSEYLETFRARSGSPKAALRTVVKVAPGVWRVTSRTVLDSQ